jgi:hypothetical protein
MKVSFRGTGHVISHPMPHIRLQTMPNQYIFALKIATAVFAEMLDNF